MLIIDNALRVSVRRIICGHGMNCLVCLSLERVRKNLALCVATDATDVTGLEFFRDSHKSYLDLVGRLDPFGAPRGRLLGMGGVLLGIGFLLLRVGALLLGIGAVVLLGFPVHGVVIQYVAWTLALSESGNGFTALLANVPPTNGTLQKDFVALGVTLVAFGRGHA